MLKVSVCSLGALLFFGLAQAHGETLNLGSDASTIKAKSHAIETEYSRNMQLETVPQKALVVEEGGAPVSMPLQKVRDEIHAIPGATNTYYTNSSSGYSYESTLKMRTDRKVGAGVSVGGTLGVLGFNMELNIEDADGVLAGFGTGPGYHTFHLAWKHAFEGDFLAPYTSVGYARWYNSRGRSSDYSKSDILDRVLTQNEKETGRFGTDFVNASLGLQYNQLNGEFAGLSFFGELTAMWEVKRSMVLPNGSIGALYYF